MGGIQLRSHHTLPVAGHQKTGHRPQRLRQRRRRPAVQQAKRLMGTGIDRHLGFEGVIAHPRIQDPQMRHHRVQAGGVERVQR
ncbi:hypothetical protein D3C75_1188070 [compost metagenome]